MHPAIATLQQAARRLQHSGNMDPSKYAWMMSQLRGVTAELDASERKARNQTSDPVDITELLHEVLAKAGVVMQLPNNTMVAGPAQSLRDLLSCLIEVALGARPNSLRLHARTGRKHEKDRETFTIELTIQSLDVPDFLRRKLWEAARTRGGEVSIVSESDCCRIGFSLPVERRLTATG
jgi:hypothetical protein